MGHLAWCWRGRRHLFPWQTPHPCPLPSLLPWPGAAVGRFLHCAGWQSCLHHGVGWVGATSLLHHSLVCAVPVPGLLRSLELSIYTALSSIVLGILKSISATLRTLLKNCGYNLLKLSGLVIRRGKKYKMSA